MKAEKQKALFKSFLSENSILVADKSAASRRRLTKTLRDLGCKRERLFSVSSFAEAKEIIETESPKLILSDYSIQGGSGFDLFKECRAQGASTVDTTMILVTSNISQTAVAKAAEEDVDSFIVKPYTVKSLETSLVNAVVNKIKPSPYIQTIQIGKEKLFSGDYEAAAQIFQRALSMNESPSLAYFYYGQANTFLSFDDKAEENYKEGLAVNGIHFKCQSGLYDILTKSGRRSEAYDVMKSLVKTFPASPERLKAVVRLAVETQNYEDLSEYYETFTGLDERTEDLVNYVCSGLYVQGRFEFRRGNREEGKEVLRKVAVSCMGEAKFLQAVITRYVEEGMHEEAEEVLRRYPYGSEETPSFLISRYLARSASMSDPEKVSMGLELFNAGHRDPLATSILIEALQRSGSSKASYYLEEARHLWPEEFQASPARKSDLAA